jgi:Zn-finger nucleic acid-binding protein
MNIPEALHCSGCGRQLGLEPLGAPDQLACPDCRQPFEAFVGGPGTLHDCSRCGGQFVEHALLKDLLERRAVYGMAAPRQPRRTNPITQPVRYLPCPACGSLMNRRNFGGCSGVIVDVCQKHGVWFDVGELPRIIAFVERGGLDKARRRTEDQDRQERRRQLHSPATAGVSLAGLGQDHRSSNADLVSDLVDAGNALVDFLGDLLRRG